MDTRQSRITENVPKIVGRSPLDVFHDMLRPENGCRKRIIATVRAECRALTSLTRRFAAGHQGKSRAMLCARLLLNSYIRASAQLQLSLARFTTYLCIGLAILTTTLCIRHKASHDPGSWFFDPARAYTPRYSAVRQQEAEAFIAAASVAPQVRKPGSAPTLCIGIPSAAREGVGYLQNALGSLLSDLTSAERDLIHLTVFVPHTDPAIHPDFDDPWLRSLADLVLLYNSSKPDFEHAADLERQARQDFQIYRQKTLFDYAFLLKSCYDIGCPFIAMVEDDVVALDGWFHRTIAGLKMAQDKTFALGKAMDDFLYLRLFYTEELHGWNSEDWRRYVSFSMGSVLGLCALVWTLRHFNTMARSLITPGLARTICLLIVPWAIVMIFAAGKSTVFPLAPGVVPMNDYGCCAQGLLFPKHKAAGLIGWYRDAGIGFADDLTEQYAAKYKQQRWALVPSVLQHVGAKSSKPGDVAPGSKPSTGRTWNFAFESNDADRLRLEHTLAAMNSSHA